MHFAGAKALWSFAQRFSLMLHCPIDQAFLDEVVAQPGGLGKVLPWLRNRAMPCHEPRVLINGCPARGAFWHKSSRIATIADRGWPLLSLLFVGEEESSSVSRGLAACPGTATACHRALNTLPFIQGDSERFCKL